VIVDVGVSRRRSRWRVDIPDKGKASCFATWTADGIFAREEMKELDPRGGFFSFFFWVGFDVGFGITVTKMFGGAGESFG
jgi:hypothetical protein